MRKCLPTGGAAYRPGLWLALVFVWTMAWTALAAGPVHAQGQPSSASCINCHRGIEMPHGESPPDALENNCVNCHGGNGNASTKEEAHVHAYDREEWESSRLPMHSYAKWNAETPAFVRFRNPGDLRIARQSCGQCHGQYVRNVVKNIMAHDALVPESGMYANGVSNLKIARIGEAYAPWTDKSGRTYFVPAKIVSNPAPSKEDQQRTGELTQLLPWPRFDVTFATDSFRVFEKGNDAATNRGLGTNAAVSGVINVAEKTRLNDPDLWFMGTNDIGGDYRSSGCTACHVIYANSQDPIDSAQYAQYGNQGFSFSGDKNIPKNEPGHPIQHRLTVSIPASQCMTCHHHNGNGHVITYLGVMWWDQDTDLEWVMKNGFAYNWFLHDAFGDYRYNRIGYHYANPKTRSIWNYNSQLKGTQFSDEHGHQWYYNAVFKRDRYGRLMDANDNLVAETDPDKWKKAVHLSDIHLDKGMQCVDCHFSADNHGEGKLYGEMRMYIEIRCQNCHGNATERADFKTAHGNDMTSWFSPWRGGPRNRPVPQFQVDGDHRYQVSMMDPNLKWDIPQVVDYITPGNPKYSAAAARAMALTVDGTWNAGPAPQAKLAHKDADMECFTCHTSWTTQCWGCHLSQAVNQKAPNLHEDDAPTRLHADYFPQTARSDAFTLGINGVWNGRKFNPISPRNPVVATVLDGNNNDGTHQQSSVGSEGFTNNYMAPNVPHTVRARETYDCTTCHLSKNKDNNAWLAQVMGEGTNGYNFIGDYEWIGMPGSIRGVRVAEGYEPQPVIGSNMMRIMDPVRFEKFVKEGRRLDKLKTATPGAGGKAFSPAQVVHAANPHVVIAKGEWAFVADGPGGFKVFDIANIDAKRAAQKVLLQPFAFGNVLQVKMHNATGLDMPASGPMDFGRPQSTVNMEGKRWEGFRYAYITDDVEGLILVDCNTFFDRNPQNNFVHRALTFNPGGALTGATGVKVAGDYAYVTLGHNGLQVVDITDPLHPKLAGRVGSPDLVDARAVQIQFRYAFVADGTGGLKVLDISDMANPRLVPGATVAIPEARSVFVMKTYAYVSAGHNGMAIVDMERPETPGAPQYFSAGGQMNDVNQITVSATYASYFAYVADGVNGMRVVRLIEADQTPNHLGWSPEPVPMLIATYHANAPVTCVWEGMRRDHVDDQAGHEIAHGARLGSHVLDANDMRKLLYDSHGQLIVVTDTHPRRTRGDWGNLPVPPQAWKPDPPPIVQRQGNNKPASGLQSKL